MRTLDKIITKLDTSRGASMGRSNVGTKHIEHKNLKGIIVKSARKERIYDCKVPMCGCCGAYDTGGAYWGLGAELRVSYTKDLSYVNFYRLGENG